MARRSKANPRRETKARSRKAPASAGPVEAEVVEEEKGMGVGDGLVLATTVLLIAAFLLTDYLRGSHYGEGLFFGG